MNKLRLYSIALCISLCLIALGCGGPGHHYNRESSQHNGSCGHGYQSYGSDTNSSSISHDHGTHDASYNSSWNKDQEKSIEKNNYSTENIEDKTLEQSDISPKVPTSEVYICPMHPYITSNTPSQCPECNMDLVQDVERE